MEIAIIPDEEQRPTRRLRGAQRLFHIRTTKQLVASCLAIFGPVGAVGCSGEDAAGVRAPERDASALVTFDAAAGEFPEGVAVDVSGHVYASLSALGLLVRIPAGSGIAQPFGQVDGLLASDFGLLGLAVGTGGDVYGAVVSDNPDARGVWRFDKLTGEAQRILGTEEIAFANSIAFHGTTLYVADSVGPDGQGAIWRVVDGG